MQCPLYPSYEFKVMRGHSIWSWSFVPLQDDHETGQNDTDQCEGVLSGARGGGEKRASQDAGPSSGVTRKRQKRRAASPARKVWL